MYSWTTKTKGVQTMKLKEMRVAKGLTTKYVAQQLGISQRLLQFIEHDGKYLPNDRIKKLAKIYNVKMSQIAEGAEKCKN